MLTLMAVHAHPDDEATMTGGVFAKASAEGIRTVLVTCTDGRAGDGPGGVKPGEPGHDPDAVAALRRTELEASCRALGISDLELLGYRDSGMMGWPGNTAPGAFWATAVQEAASRLAGLMKRYRPDVVVTYDANGFYGHPDHIQAHRITMAAVELTGIPAKVYWTTASRASMAELGKAMAEPGISWDDDDPQDDGPEIGLPDEEITTWVDIRDYSDQKYDALHAHESQADDIFFLKLGRERFRQLMGEETFVRVIDTTQAPVPERDLFAGLA
jgi:LmbE family N-acetylglucosaminyl deacetylase